MQGFHLQGNVDNWKDAVARLPSGAPLKVVDGVQRCAEAKGVNHSVYTVVRHHVHEQNPSGDYHQHARQFFASFVDETFRKLAWSVDAVQEYNEYFANSQGHIERARWVNWIRACVDVWRDEYRTQPQYSHIDLILAETAVGNDIPLDVAKIAHENPFCVLGYHPYVPVWQGQIRPDAWQWYSGRWDAMDSVYRNHGYRVRWFFGEFGAVGHNGPGWPNSLAASDGWRHKDVYNGKLTPYLEMMTDWVNRCKNTVAYNEGRVIGATIFTSGGGSLWKHFEVKQPEMTIIAEHIYNLMDGEEPPEPPTPPPTTPAGLPRVQYNRTYWVARQDTTLEDWVTLAKMAYHGRYTIGFSYDDAGVGALDSKTAVLYDLDFDEHREYMDWYAEHYPGTNVQYSVIPGSNGDVVAPPAGKFVDVSHHQGDIDWWQMVKNGVTHAYIRGSIGLVGDRKYQRNVDGAQRVGIQFGVYHYFKNNIDAAKQAAFFNENTTLLGTLPPALDIEDSKNPPTPESWLIWLEMIEDLKRVRPVIYTAKWYWNNIRFGGPIPWAKNYKLWVHDFNNDPPNVPTDWDTWWLWQYGQDPAELYGAQSIVIDVNKFNVL